MRLNTELDTLEAIVRSIADAAVEPSAFASLRQEVLAENERIKKSFVREAFGLRKEKKIERYIQYHQSALVALADQLVQHLSPNAMEDIHAASEEGSYIDLVKFVYGRIEDLLVYIEKHFVKYFNQAGKTPESYRFIVHRELKQRVPDVRYALERKGINKRLLTLVLYPLDSFIEEVRAHEVSYRKIIYLRQLLAELSDLGTGRLTGRRLDFKACLSMGYLNYNTHRFYQYCVQEITALVQAQPTLSLQIEKLSFMMKIVNQVQPKPGFRYHEKQASLKDQLSAWLTAELYFFEKRQQLAAGLPAHADDPVQKDFRLQLNISVSQLACLLRGLKETGVIKNNNVLELLKFMAGIVQTKSTDKVSWESLRTKYYNPEGSARDSVKDVALGLFNYMRK